MYLKICYVLYYKYKYKQLMCPALGLHLALIFSLLYLLSFLDYYS